jgi:putative transcriptional regulator
MTNSTKAKSTVGRFTETAPKAKPAAKPAAEPVRKHRSEAFEAIHSAAAGLLSIGAIDKQTMREFDVACLVEPNLKASDVRRIRKGLKVSQDVFARYLGTSKSTVQKWENSANTPNPFAQRLMHVIEKHGLGILG